ncbi:hypothetical protein DAEQUDRAFT_813035 [Daedalea quercina L-15889]|uniref:RRM domain-containing protein n=1 Tax=Daedalea quercina L-15889 TaxID=1314783 RepID=A0A165NMZ6_9APHY|nr:hypothetical protein DAEQUDRAFT_813035 [Daedalea quercina L-15889]
MSSRVDCVVVVETAMSLIELRNIYAQCGHILSISPWEARTDRIYLTCFVEFADESAVKRARVLQVPNTKLHVVSLSPQLAARFLSVVQPVQPLSPSLSTPAAPMMNLRVAEVKREPHDDTRLLKRMSEGEIASSTDSTPKKKARRGEKNAYSRYVVPGSHGGDPQNPRTTDMRTPKATGKAALSFLPSLSRQASGKENDAQAEGDHSNSTLRRTLPLPRRNGVAPSSQDTTPRIPRDVHSRPDSTITPDPILPEPSTTLTLAEPEGTAQVLPSSDSLGAVQLSHAHTGTPVVSSIITLTYNGKPVNCDLRKLEDDPAKIIAVLKATANCSPERDKWMLVAVQYRVRGHFKAAIGVLDTMVEVMTSAPVSLSNSDLKPVFLMLSSCHRDLAAQSRSEDVAFHVRRATECLQQVYGVDVPRAQVTSEFAEARARSCMDLPSLLSSASDSGQELAHARECLADAGNLPTTRAHQEQSPSRKRAREQSTVPTELGDDKRRSDRSISAHAQRDEPDRSRARADSHSRSQSERDRHVHALEREIQATRDRAADEHAILLGVRTAKRKLEDDLVAEHAARRRLEREADSTAGELARTREELVRAREDVARLRDELSRARRGEEGALEQAAAEVASRRAAEGRVDVLREELGRLRNEVTRARAAGREMAEEGREAERKARETFARLGEMFVKAGRGELPLGLALDDGGQNRGDGPTTPASERGHWEEDRRSRSASTSGRGWGPKLGVENERR